MRGLLGLPCRRAQHRKRAGGSTSICAALRCVSSSSCCPPSCPWLPPRSDLQAKQHRCAPPTPAGGERAFLPRPLLLAPVVGAGERGWEDADSVFIVVVVLEACLGVRRVAVAACAAECGKQPGACRSLMAGGRWGGGPKPVCKRACAQLARGWLVSSSSLPVPPMQPFVIDYISPQLMVYLCRRSDESCTHAMREVSVRPARTAFAFPPPTPRPAPPPHPPCTRMPPTCRNPGGRPTLLGSRPPPSPSLRPAPRPRPRGQQAAHN